MQKRGLSRGPVYRKLNYGAVELVRSYRQYLGRAFALSAFLHVVLAVVLIFLLPAPEPETTVTVVRITGYEELKTVPAISASSAGLTAYPVIASPDLTPSNVQPLARQVIRPKGTQKKISSLGRTPRRSLLGDLPSPSLAQKLDPFSQSDLGATVRDSRTSTVNGGNNGGRENNLPGGTPVIGSGAQSPSGNAPSGVGSRVKPTPTAGGVGAGEAYGTRDGEEGGNGFTLNWLKGEVRRRISGGLPQYPPGETVDAEIALLTVVTPDGAVRSTTPVQKGNRRFEDAAMRQVRLWKFEPLRPALPQVDQSCVITFLFKQK